jgi:hypothetical protein
MWHNRSFGELGIAAQGEGGTMLKTSLDHTKEAALQAALAGVQQLHLLRMSSAR